MSTIDVTEGGDLVYTMTAVDPAQVAFMEQHGLPLATESRKRFTEVARPQRLGYVSLVDFVPGTEPYEHLTTVDLAPTDSGTLVTMTIDPMHDEEWTQRIVAGRANELDNLAPPGRARLSKEPAATTRTPRCGRRPGRAGPSRSRTAPRSCRWRSARRWSR